jgi:sugar diacid utilization regulator
LLPGISERQAGELAIRQWIQRNRNQVSLETWAEARGSAVPVDRALVNVHVAIMKAELRQILDELQIVAAECQMEVLRRLQKLMPTAQALVEETRDKELREVLTALAAEVTL